MSSSNRKATFNNTNRPGSSGTQLHKSGRPDKLSALATSSASERPQWHEQGTLDGVVKRSRPAGLSIDNTTRKRRKTTDEPLSVDQYRSEDGKVGLGGQKAITKHLLRTLESVDNPITNSDLYDRTAQVVTCATDVRQEMQRSGSKFYISEKEYFASRQEKAGLKIYVNGYTGPKISDRELKRLISVHGGDISLIDSSSCTHIVVDKNLSASKAQKFLGGRGKGKGGATAKQIVQVDWALDSIAQSKRLGEAAYAIIKPSNQASFAVSGTRDVAQGFSKRPLITTAAKASARPSQANPADIISLTDDESD